MSDEDLTTAYMVGYHKRDDEVAALKAEIERLRRELAQTKARLKPIDRALAAVADKWVEIETARNLLRETTGRQSDE